MQDRAEILRLGDKIVVLVADGSGGRSGAAQAAERFILSAREAAETLTTAQDCVQLLIALDQEIERAAECGETTGVIVVATSTALRAFSSSAAVGPIVHSLTPDALLMMMGRQLESPVPDGDDEEDDGEEDDEENNDEETSEASD